MGMGTHTLTSAGIVDNNNQLEAMATLLQLEFQLRDNAEQIRASKVEGLDAFLPLFEDEGNKLILEICALRKVISFHIKRSVA